MKVAFLGTGLMGLPMAQRLLEANVDLIAYNRTREKLAPLKANGAEIAEHPRHAIRAADCVILMLTNAPAIYSVLLSDTSFRMLAGRTVIQMGTITPTESKEIRDTVVAAGGEYIEAPVLGSTTEATQGKLIVMVGAYREQYQRNLELLKHFGPKPVYVGQVGTAAGLQLAFNQLISSLTAAFALSLKFVQRQDIDVNVFMQILRESALYAPTFDNKLQRMLDNNYDNPSFPTKHLLKDTVLFIDEAKNAGLNINGIDGVRSILDTAIRMSFAQADYSSLFAAMTSSSDAE
ncbi:hydroxyacid dehydrogenase [Calothrix sp. HK-06]|nr:hydroxyacid dehydrogenase [Calothrix sp. HK-06]